MLVVVVIKHLEGERDYGQQTLATCTFVRSHFRRRVVHMALVYVNVEVVKRSFFCCKRQTRGLYVRDNRICAHQINHCFCILLLGDGQDRIYEKLAFGRDQTMKCKC